MNIKNFFPYFFLFRISMSYYPVLIHILTVTNITHQGYKMRKNS